MAVALGVGFVAGTLVFTDTMGKKIDDILGTSSEGVDVLVRAQSDFQEMTGSAANAVPVPEDLLPVVEKVQGVDDAWGTVWGFAEMLQKSGEPIAPVGPPLLGGAWDQRDFELAVGRAPQQPTEVAIDDQTATKYGFEVGDPIQVLFQGPSEPFTVAGIFKMPPAYMGATIVTFPMDTAQRVLNRQGSFDSIAVRGASGIPESELRDRVASVLTPGYEAVTQAAVNAEAKDALDEVMGIFRSALLVFALVALFVGAFIIFNTFSILVAQRTRELGLLRAVGASKGQVVSSVLTEAVVVGLIASVVGIGIGILFALGIFELLRATGTEGSLKGMTLRFVPRTALVALVAGVAVTVVSALSPARRATQVPPVVAIGGTFTEVAGSIRRRVVVGGLVTAGGVAALLLGLFDAVAHPLIAVGVGALAVFIGVAILSALFARPLAGLVGAPLPRVFGESAHLGRQNSMRNPKRTASTAAALMIGVGLVGFVTIVAASIKESATKAIGDTMVADFMLEPESMASTGGTTGVSPELAQRLRYSPGVGVVSEIRYGQFGYQGKAQTLIAVDPTTFSQVVELDGATQASIEKLSDVGVLVDANVAKDHGWKVGDTIPMQFQRSGTQGMTVEGSFDWSGANASYLIALSSYERNYEQQMDALIGVRNAPGSTAADIRTEIDRVLQDFPNVKLEDRQQFTASRMSMVDTMLAFITALLLLSVLIALLGIANTLAMSMYERTRELGLLRAVGMSRRQLRSMVRWEAVIIGVIGALLGLAIGVFFGWALVRAMRDQGVTEFVLPVARLVAYVLLAAVAGVLASLFPARRAAKLNILEAIAFE